jgi:hypothetical protein
MVALSQTIEKKNKLLFGFVILQFCFVACKFLIQVFVPTGGLVADGSILQDDGRNEPVVRGGDACHSHRERRVASPTRQRSGEHKLKLF